MKIASSTTDQATDVKIGWTSGKAVASGGTSVGLPNNSRAACTVEENGFQIAIGCSQSGSVVTGTNALDRNVTGNSQMNPAVFAVSGPLTDSPIIAPIQVI